jgi:hypothetical protein
MNLSERTLQPMGAQIPQNFRSHLKILVARMVTSNNFHTEEPQILDATIKNLVAVATRYTGFGHLCNDYFEL